MKFNDFNLYVCKQSYMRYNVGKMKYFAEFLSAVKIFHTHSMKEIHVRKIVIIINNGQDLDLVVWGLEPVCR